MCIIISKPKGINFPSKNIIKTSFKNNPDGAGFMYVDKGEVIIKKGYFSVKKLYNDLLKLPIEKAVVIHFRIGTSGKNDAQTTHPYPISNIKDDLRTLELRTDVGVCHNGIISDCADVKMPLLNDTQVFIKDYLTTLKELDNEFYKNEKIMNLVTSFVNSKLTLLDKDEVLYYVGKFIEKDGIYYSNNTYNDSISYIGYNKCNSNYYDKYYDKYTVFSEEDELEGELVYEYLKEGFSMQLLDGSIEYVIYNNQYVVDQYNNVYNVSSKGIIEDTIIYKNVIIFDTNYEEYDII